MQGLSSCWLNSRVSGWLGVGVWYSRGYLRDIPIAHVYCMQTNSQIFGVLGALKEDCHCSGQSPHFNLMIYDKNVGAQRWAFWIAGGLVRWRSPQFRQRSLSEDGEPAPSSGQIKYLETQSFCLYLPVHSFQMLSLVVKRGSMTVEGKMDPGQLAIPIPFIHL